MRRAALTGLQRNPPVPAGGGRRQSVIRSLAAPVGGWNARDPLAVMRPTDAVTLTNWFPRISDCAVRGGAQNHVTGFAARPKTLMLHNGLTGTNKMFAVTDGGIFDATSAGAVGASVLSRTNGYHTWTQMAVSGGNYLIACNGTDAPAYYDGTTWTAVTGATTPALTGVTTTNLVAVNAFKRRLFFLEKNKLNFWYLAADAIGGALTEYVLGPLCTKGGYTMAMATWTLDAGDGADDYAVFVTSEGQAIVFTGTNPGNASFWQMVGVYEVGKPLGRRCFRKLGGDLVILTEYGAFELSKVLRTATIDAKLALSNKIEGAFVDAARSYGSLTGWTVVVLPSRGALLVNVPTVDGGVSAEQYVMNTTTRSWCKFTGWDASDIVVFNKELYYADATVVAKCWTDTFSDFGANISALAQTAFFNFGDARIKDWKMFRPILRTNGSIQYSQGMAIDFDATPTLSAASYTVVQGARFDVDNWDVGYWAAGLSSTMQWNTPGARHGEWGAGLLRVDTDAIEVQWASNDYLYEVGGIM